MIKGLTIYDAWMKKYPGQKKAINYFVQACEGDTSFENLTKAKLIDYVTLLKANYAPNSAKQYAKMLNVVLQQYNDVYDWPKNYTQVLTLKPEAVVSTWLSEDDIYALSRVKTKTTTENIVLMRFLLGCVTGARYSDVVRLRKDNIINGKLVFVTQKTGTRCAMPLSPMAERILNTPLFIETADTEILGGSFNNSLQVLCERAGIVERTMVHHCGVDKIGPKYSFVSSHTARRSFATNLYQKSRDIFLVSKYMGHGSVEMTSKYILDIGEAPDEVREFFERYR